MKKATEHIIDRGQRMSIPEEQSLEKINVAKRALAETQDIHRVLKLRDQAVAISFYAAAKGAEEVATLAKEVQARAERKAGQFLAEMERSPGARTDRTLSQAETRSEYQQMLEDTGLARATAHRWQTIALVPDEEFERHIVKANNNGKELTISGIYRMARKFRPSPPVKSMSLTEKPIVELANWYDWLPRQEQCDLLLTDPPYSTDLDDVFDFAHDWLPLALEKVKPTGRAYICIGAYPNELQAYLMAAKGCVMPLSGILVWTYQNTLGPSPSHDYKLNWQAILYFRGSSAAPLNCPQMIEQFTVHNIPAPDGRHGERYHKWQKPLGLGERLIRHSTKEGDLVLDPFVGTGTFVLAANKLNRIGRGCDIDEATLDIAAQRGCEFASQS